MAGELGAVVEGHGLAPGGRQGREQAGEGAAMGAAALEGGRTAEEQAGVAVVEGEDGLAEPAEEHEIGFPMPGAWRSAAAAGRSARGRRC